MSAIPSAHLIPRYPPHVHTGTWGTLETFTPAVRANKVCTARRAKRNDIALMAPKKPSSTQNATLQSMGMDVIKQYPGPLTVSRAVKVDVPGKHFPQLTGAEQNASYTCLSNVFEGRSAMLSLSAAEYRRSLRRQGIRQLAAAAAKAAPAAATAAPAAPPSAPSRAQPAAWQPASGATAGVNGRRCRACCKAAQVGADGWARPLAAGTAT